MSLIKCQDPKCRPTGALKGPGPCAGARHGLQSSFPVLVGHHGEKPTNKSRETAGLKSQHQAPIPTLHPLTTVMFRSSRAPQSTVLQPGFQDGLLVAAPPAAVSRWHFRAQKPQDRSRSCEGAEPLRAPPTPTTKTALHGRSLRTELSKSPKSSCGQR